MADFKIGQDYIVDKLGYAQSYPIGSVVIIMSSTIPDGWLLCDGRPVSRTDYSELFSVVGTTYGPGDGTTFNLPPLVVNATHNPTGRFAVSRQSSEPGYPANFSHTHSFYKAAATNYTVGNYTATHIHADMNIDSTSVGMNHNHANMAGGNVLNNVTSNSRSSRASSANNTVEYHNDYVHDHGSTSTATLSMSADRHANGGHTHPMQVHSVDNISHSHTVSQNTNVTVTISGVPTIFEGINSVGNTHTPLSKGAYFIIKY
jgi:microcystin-dependent protein